MKKVVMICCQVLVVCFVFVLPARADLGTFLSDLDARAKADIKHFNSAISSQFKIPLPNVQAVLNNVKNPADVFMCFQLSKMTGVHIDQVVTTYQKNSGRGWGVIAKELGIKPGSPAFHALKKGDFGFEGSQKVKKNKKKKKGKSKDKGKGKKNK